MKELQTNVLPLINALLQANPIALPTLKAVKLNNPRIGFGEGYMLMEAEIAFNAVPILDDYASPTAAIQCPNIPGAHQDACI